MSRPEGTAHVGYHRKGMRSTSIIPTLANFYLDLDDQICLQQSASARLRALVAELTHRVTSVASFILLRI